MKILGENMQTEQGRLMAIERWKYVLDFIGRIIAENVIRDQ